MNSTQRSVAHAVGQHFKRQWQSMGRSGPVARIQADQNELVAKLCGIFTEQNPAFLADEFCDAVHQEETQ